VFPLPHTRYLANIVSLSALLRQSRNAYIGPRVSGYLGELTKRLRDGEFSGELLLMQSAGGLYDVESAESNCIQLLESGPAGGVVRRWESLCGELGIERAVAFDMGGTTAKACVVVNGEASLARDYFVGQYNDGTAHSRPVIDIEENLGQAVGSYRLDRRRRRTPRRTSQCRRLARPRLLRAWRPSSDDYRRALPPRPPRSQFP